ncbi:hypothetical protein [Roseibium sediminicola]|uniref:Uncharacterized protein n=1 Tax=Roseibium sediminicola TaxID=2933272 RepID=A0ABT0GXK0_9HYPH|nr:hypothetical protein [Roseibium sp. CAU 1639]MCK7614169.1 hypothetical protein [Roseibium sp. CAU 1639]
MSSMHLAEKLKATLRELDGRPVSAGVLKELVQLDALDCTMAHGHAEMFTTSPKPAVEHKLKAI